MAAMASRPRSSRSRPKLQSSRNRAARKSVSYREQSSDNDDLEGSSGQNEDDGPSRTPRSNHIARPKPKPSNKRKALHPPTRPLGATKKSKTSNGKGIAYDNGAPEKNEEEDININYSGKSMPWHTLPYQILVSIFQYASHPLIDDDNYAPLPSIRWLWRSAFTCKAFAEPAFSVLYFSPPLAPPSRAQALITQLATQSENPTFNYRAKVKYIEVEAVDTLMHKYAGQEPVDLGTLISLTPQLRGIGIRLSSDGPKHRNAGFMSRPLNGKLVYRPSMFQALTDGNIKLQDWTWNEFLAGQTGAPSLEEVLRLTPLCTLRSLSLLNYRQSSYKDKQRYQDTLGSALSTQQKLTKITFTSTSIVTARLLLMLPGQLQSLHLVNCPCLTSVQLFAYLVERGQNLRELVLDHNHALNLSFLVGMAEKCPKLERLKMDLVYYGALSTIWDSSPVYPVLLKKGEVPTWPASLQSLELYHLRKWDLDAAEAFFGSLTGSAETLSNLRLLKIKASLGESNWRNRIEFRDKWTSRLEQVFLRQSPPPNPHLKTVASYNAHKKRQSKGQTSSPLAVRSRPSETIVVTNTMSPEAKSGRSRVSHVKVPKAINSSDESDSDAPLIHSRMKIKSNTDNDAPLSRLRRSTRSGAHRDNAYALSESSPNSQHSQRSRRRRRRRRGSNDSSSEDSAAGDDASAVAPRRTVKDLETPSYIQGMCDVVDVLITNLRPTEEQLNEDDFLDEELSGDGDWNEDDDDADGGDGYAW